MLFFEPAWSNLGHLVPDPTISVFRGNLGTFCATRSHGRPIQTGQPKRVQSQPAHPQPTQAEPRLSRTVILLGYSAKITSLMGCLVRVDLTRNSRYQSLAC